MLGHTHALFGLTTLAAVHSGTLALSGHTTVGLIQPHPVDGIPVGPFLCAGAAVLGALLPDLDAGEATIHHELGPISFLIRSGLKFSGVKHRGVFHSGLATFVTLGLGTLIGGWYGYADVGLALGLGYFSHVVLADALTISGVPLAWPVSAGRCHLLPRRLRVRTGGPVEQLLFGLVSITLIWLLPDLMPADLITHVRQSIAALLH